MKLSNVQSSINLLGHFFDRQLPFDVVMCRHFRGGIVGSYDRREVAEFSYGILRNLEKLDYIVHQCTENTATDYEKMDPLQRSRLLVLVYLRLKQKLSVSDIAEIFAAKRKDSRKLTESECDFLRKCEKQSELFDEDILNKNSGIPFHVLLNYPEWMEVYLRRAFPKNFEEEMAALNQKACVDLRVNTLKATRKKVLEELDYLPVVPTKLSKNGVRILEGRISRSSSVLGDGLAEVQDEGSQLVAAVCNAQPGDTVVDYCAGAGGKTLALAADMNNKGRILVLDKYPERMQMAALRFRRAGVFNAACYEISGKWIKRHRGCADIVLTDVPCSGTGTWRRNPDMRARFIAQDLKELQEIQAEILEKAAVLVKTGGRLVYSTCSVLLEENDDQIDHFLRNFPDFRKGKVKISAKNVVQNDYLRLSPFRNGTDGFFAAVLEKFK